MIENKNIDRVFQENLKDLEIYPNERVWKNIENQLQGKPQRNYIVLWQKLSGVAIVFLLLFSIGFGYFRINKKTIIKNGTINNISTDNTVVKNTSKQETPVIPLKDIEGDLASATKNKSLETNEQQVIKTLENIEIKDIRNSLNSNKNELADLAITGQNTSKEDAQNKLSQEEKALFDMSFVDQNTNQYADIDIKEKRNKKWSVGPLVSAVYFNTLQEGSPISNDLENNKKTSDEALSYGIKIDYQLSDKIKIQSGVNKVGLAYNTEDVRTTLSSSKIPNHTISATNSGLHISSSIRSNVDSEVSTDQLSKSNSEGDLNQSLEYVEIPLEMKYNIYQSRVGFNVVGGFSTFILTNNQVSLVSQNATTKLGEANNINIFNFSGNIGVDLDYKINSDWFLNVTPMVKYQFNTFSNSAGNFRPYYFGVYSGINYRF